MSESRMPMVDKIMSTDYTDQKSDVVDLARRLELALAQAEKCLQVCVSTLPHMDGRSAHGLLETVKPALATIKDLRDGK